ncbi:MAG: hypothetical protein J4400_03825 [Candidatus Aenigmarchaeota archaeon]|nr:hypothetical protein [Candidatus Aenigmarchaeota archaeon]
MRIRKARESDSAALSKIVDRNYSRKYGMRSRKEIEAMFRNYACKP